MPSYLIGYKDSENYNMQDPLFQEFTYGDSSRNGKKLLGLHKGDYLFFHTTVNSKRYITAYYFVEEVHLLKDIIDDPLIKDMYHNHHLKKNKSQVEVNESIVFGNPIRSKELNMPVELNEHLLKQLSRPSNLSPNQTPLGAITSALRTWKALSISDIKLLLDKIKKNAKILSTDHISFTEDDEGFPEGRVKLKQHLVKERNPEVIKLAKENFLKLHGKLFCQVCKFDFKEHYGGIGDGYIEGHHTKPISEMKEDEETKVEDIALVCANCHRMLHRKRPWLSVGQLKDLLAK